MVLRVNLVVHRRGELIFGHVGLRNDAAIVLVEGAVRLSRVVIN